MFLSQSLKTPFTKVQSVDHFVHCAIVGQVSRERTEIEQKVIGHSFETLLDMLLPSYTAEDMRRFQQQISADPNIGRV